MKSEEIKDIKSNIEYGVFFGINCRVVYSGKEIELVCVTDIAKHYNKRFDRFFTTLVGSEIKKRLIGIRGKGGFSLLPVSDAFYFYQWCQSPLPQNCVERFEKTAINGIERLLKYSPYSNIKLLKQVRVGKYVVDAYIPELSICIEYDEEYHLKQSEKDKERELEIKKIIGSQAMFFRIVKGSEIDGYGAFMKMLYTGEIHKEPKPYHFSNEALMINEIVLGTRTKTNRDELTDSQLKMITDLEAKNAAYIDLGMSYQERKERLFNIFTLRTETTDKKKLNFQATTQFGC